MAIRTMIYAILFINFLLEPILNHYEFNKLKKNSNRRLHYYYMTILGLWIPTLLVLLLIPLQGITLSGIGIKNIQLGSNIISQWVSYGVLLFAVLYLLSIIYHMVCMKISGQYRTAYYRKVQQSETPGVVLDVMLPVSDKERKLWNLVSISAGVCEELLFRGFLFFSLREFLPELPIVIIIIITSFVFGLWHTYQGLKGMGVTFFIGLLFSSLYLSIGSIIPIIILHILMDWSAKDAHVANNH